MRTDNGISGHARVDAAVMAGNVNGGIHFHPAAPATRLLKARQLAPVTAAWTNRTADIERLHAIRLDCPDYAVPIVVITGPSGVGKSGLAARWGHVVADDYPDGQIVVDLRGSASTGPATTAEVLRSMLRALGIGLDSHLTWDEHELIGLWRSASADLQLLVLLEDAAGAEQVLPLVPGGPGCLVMLTSRRPLAQLIAHGAVHHHVLPLSAAAAIQFLARCAGADRIAREPQAAAELAAACGYLPLPLALIGADLALNPGRRVIEVARSLARPPLANPSSLHSRSERPVTPALDHTYEALPSASACFYRQLSALPVPDFDGAMAAAAAGLTATQAAAHLAALSERGLLDDAGQAPVRGPLFRMRDEVRDHARQMATDEDGTAATEAVLRSYIDWLLAATTTAERMLTPHHLRLDRTYRYPPAMPMRFDNHAEALSWLETQLPSFTSVLAAAAAAGWDSSVWQLVHAMYPAWHRLRPTALQITTHELGLAAAQRDGNRLAQAEMASAGAGGLRAAGRYDEAVALLTFALKLAEEDGDERGQAQYLLGIGSSLHAGERYDEAAPHLLAAKERFEALGRWRSAALAQILLGSIASFLGRFEVAFQLLTQARQRLVEVGDQLDAARALAWLADAHSRHGEFERAQELLSQAGAEFGEVSRHWQARVVELHGQAAEREGLPDRARELYEDSRCRFDALASSRDTARLVDRLSALGAG
ncbi:hypothetical protein OG455_27500 [Kitasatospora sp. NBC_01287]|uniref:NB-ARC domain-containing protein n=1 Tax=Kitasatospora sp. NBC_01287 TaxID=2903573 RepID=UPI00224E098F|nr:NB-ARC domain-containing protein [Kitasatospora sp. NBC_01287]MCX4749206.1 hypothetical protein [Kitasatospora sp. NBC_01287]